jgi:thioredoxin-like negative regulator of GroEL
MGGMRHRLAAATFAVALFAGGGTASAEIRWETNLDRASVAAQATNQPMLIEFWAVWCEPCKEMDRDVYGDERIASAMSKVRPVRVDIDREPALRRKYDVSGTPTLLVTDSFGRELFRYAGALPLDRMVQLLDALPADVSSINRLSAVLAADNADFEALRGMGRELRALSFYRTSSDYYERALREREGRHPGVARTELLVGLERNALDLRLFADAAHLCESALRELAGRPEEPEVRVDLGRALLGLGKTEEAARVLRTVISRHKDTPAAAEATRLLGGG